MKLRAWPVITHTNTLMMILFERGNLYRNVMKDQDRDNLCRQHSGPFGWGFKAFAVEADSAATGAKLICRAVGKEGRCMRLDSKPKLT